MRRTPGNALLLMLFFAALLHVGFWLLGGGQADGAKAADEVRKHQVKAFPSAEGFGAETRGAYGKAGVTPKVYQVTTLEDPATRAAQFDGSFRWAIEAPEPRVILFAVGGYIVIKKPLVIENPYVTIAGQTAPGDGICLRNDPAYGHTTLLIATHDVIVRHLRARPGRANSGVKVSSQQGIQVGNAKARTYNVILDHCSATWGIDGCMQTGAAAHDVTFQWCIISEGLNQAGHDKGAHSRGLAFYVGRGEEQENNGRFSVHHNLMSHVQYRVPHIATKFGMVEVINNIVYHTTQIGMNINTTAHGVSGASKNRFVKNYLLRTADTRGDISFRDHVPGVLVHAHGNIGPSRGDDSLADNLSLGTAHMANCPVCNATKPPSERNHWTKDPLCTDPKGGAFPYPKVRVTEDDNAKVALARISGTGDFAGKLSVGATKPTRDAVDARILRQLTSYLANPKDAKTVPVPGGPRGGLLDDPAQVGGYPKLAGGTPPADTDGDGIPDAWEIARKLDPKDARDAHQTAANGYSNLENYLNELAGDTLP